MGSSARDKQLTSISTSLSVFSGSDMAIVLYIQTNRIYQGEKSRDRGVRDREKERGRKTADGSDERKRKVNIEDHTWLGGDIYIYTRTSGSLDGTPHGKRTPDRIYKWRTIYVYGMDMECGSDQGREKRERERADDFGDLRGISDNQDDGAQKRLRKTPHTGGHTWLLRANILSLVHEDGDKPAFRDLVTYVWAISLGENQLTVAPAEEEKRR